MSLRLTSILVFCGLNMIANFVFAASEEEDFKTQISNADQAIATFNGNLGKLEADLKAARAKVEDQERSLGRTQKEAADNPNNSVHDSALGRFADWALGPAITQADRKRLEESRAEMERLEGQRNAVLRQRDAAIIALGNTRIARNGAQAKLNTLEGKFEDTLKMVGLQTRFENLDHSIITTNHMIEVISRKYDQSLVGVYMRDKIQALLDSDALCSMVKKAAGGTCGKTDPSKLDSIFKGTAHKTAATTGAPDGSTAR
jgi:chromosome segregation ATPase